jgi:hypothetical protein
VPNRCRFPGTKTVEQIGAFAPAIWSPVRLSFRWVNWRQRAANWHRAARPIKTSIATRRRLGQYLPPMLAVESRSSSTGSSPSRPLPLESGEFMPPVAPLFAWAMAKINQPWCRRSNHLCIKWMRKFEPCFWGLAPLFSPVLARKEHRLPVEPCALRPKIESASRSSPGTLRSPRPGSAPGVPANPWKPRSAWRGTTSFRMGVLANSRTFCPTVLTTRFLGG